MRTVKQVRRTARAFTMIEILAVMVIIAMMVGAAALGIPRILDQNRQRAAKAEMSTLSDALELFKMDVGRYPTEDEALSVLLTAPADATNWNGPYLKAPALPVDPWGTAYMYHTRVGPSGDTEFLIVSYGSDKKPGGTGFASDIGSNGVTDPEGWLGGGTGLAGSP
jgi:general secretion pathway protein G